MAELRINPYLVTADLAMKSDAELRHPEFALRTDGIVPRSFKNHKWKIFGGQTKVAFPALFKLSQIGWKQKLYNDETKEKILHNWATGELRSPISASANSVWKITLEYLKTESIDNDQESVRKQKQAYNAQQMLTFESEELERELDGALNLQRIEQATQSLDKLTAHQKKTRQVLDSRKGAQDRQDDLQIEEDALADKVRQEQEDDDAKIAALVAQSKLQ